MSSFEGISCDSGSPVIAHCIISENGGSGIDCEHSTLTIDQCTIVENNGGIDGWYCSFYISQCLIKDNISDENFAGIRLFYSFLGSSSLIDQSVITGNVSGGIYCFSTQLTLRRLRCQ